MRSLASLASVFNYSMNLYTGWLAYIPFNSRPLPRDSLAYHSRAVVIQCYCIFPALSFFIPLLHSSLGIICWPPKSHLFLVSLSLLILSHQPGMLFFLFPITTQQTPFCPLKFRSKVPFPHLVGFHQLLTSHSFDRYLSHLIPRKILHCCFVNKKHQVRWVKKLLNTCPVGNRVGMKTRDPRLFVFVFLNC